MICHGTAPYLECSSRGDRRLSAFYARVWRRGGKTIEELYQSSKVLAFTGKPAADWRTARGKKAINQVDCAAFYSRLWDEYILENPRLLAVLCAASGLSDDFGQPEHCCQATELWRIRCEALARK